tara:strand:- start:1280 stop:1885 length:606 start_codon:yes stop_codon:yes gene_type:complete
MGKAKWLFVLLVLCLIAYTLTLRANLNDYKRQVKKLDLQQTEFITMVDKQGLLISEQEQIILSQKDAIEMNLLEIENLKKVNSQVSVVTQTIVDSVFIPFQSDTLKNFGLYDKWYGLSGIVENRGVKLDSIYFNNDMRITIGYKKNGWFKKPSPIVKIKNENPYSRVVNMQNVVIDNPTKWYEKKGFLIGVGFLGGIVIMK